MRRLRDGGGGQAGDQQFAYLIASLIDVDHHDGLDVLNVDHHNDLDVLLMVKNVPRMEFAFLISRLD